MKKTFIIIILLFTVSTLKAQNVPYEKLENFSKEISKLQFEANGKTYNDGNKDYEISFPEENFTILFNSQLATNMVYKKSNNKELMYLTENISLGRVVGFTSEVIDKNIVVWKINFGKFNVTTQVFDNGKLTGTTSSNELILYEYINSNSKASDPSFFNSFSQLCNTMKKSIGMITDEVIESENKEWNNKNSTMADFVKKHPNSIRTMQANMTEQKILAKEKYKVEKTIFFMDSIAQSSKIKIGMSEMEFKQQNPEIAEEVFKKKNTYTSDGGNYKAYSSRKKIPQFKLESLIFKYEKLSDYFYSVYLYSQSERVKEFNKYVSLVKANLSLKYYNISESLDWISIRHPTENWILEISYRPDLDAYTDGIKLRFNFFAK